LPNFIRDLARLFTNNGQICVPSYGGSTASTAPIRRPFRLGS